MSQTVFVALLNEAVDVWRPVTAVYDHEDQYILSGPVPNGERWEFQPGELVRCREQKLDEGVICLVAFARGIPLK